MRMMKAVMLVAALVMGASVAQASGTMTFGLGGGVTIPMGEFGDFAKLGFNGGVYGDYWVKDNYAFGVDITGNMLDGSDDAVDSLKLLGATDPSIKNTLISFGAHGKWVVPMNDAPVAPWLTYGVAMYNFKVKAEGSGFSTDVSESDFGFNLGGGLDFKGGDSMKPGVDVKYHYVMTEGDATTYVTAGAHLTFSTTGTSK